MHVLNKLKVKQRKWKSFCIKKNPSFHPHSEVILGDLPQPLLSNVTRILDKRTGKETHKSSETYSKGLLALCAQPTSSGSQRAYISGRITPGEKNRFATSHHFFKISCCDVRHSCALSAGLNMHRFLSQCLPFYLGAF